MTQPPESRKYLHDALRAVGRVLIITASKSFADYQADDVLRWAVERQLEITGEALAQMARRDPDTAQLVPELARIVAFRNVLAHGYEAVDDERVWRVVVDHVPALRRVLARLLGEEES